MTCLKAVIMMQLFINWNKQIHFKNWIIWNDGYEADGSYRSFTYTPLEFTDNHTIYTWVAPQTCHVLFHGGVGNGYNEIADKVSFSTVTSEDNGNTVHVKWISADFTMSVDGTDVGTSADVNKGSVCRVMTIAPQYPYCLNDGRTLYNPTEDEVRTLAINQRYVIDMNFSAYAIE